MTYMIVTDEHPDAPDRDMVVGVHDDLAAVEADLERLEARDIVFCGIYEFGADENFEVGDVLDDGVLTHRPQIINTARARHSQ